MLIINKRSINQIIYKNIFILSCSGRSGYMIDDTMIVLVNNKVKGLPAYLLLTTTTTNLLITRKYNYTTTTYYIILRLYLFVHVKCILVSNSLNFECI